MEIHNKNSVYPEPAVDLGQVGQVVSINTEILDVMKDSNIIPVIAPIGIDSEGVSYNINADSVAGEIAKVLKADKLMLLTNVPGVKDKKGNILTGLKIKQVNEERQQHISSLPQEVKELKKDMSQIKDLLFRLVEDNHE